MINVEIKENKRATEIYVNNHLVFIINDVYSVLNQTAINGQILASDVSNNVKEIRQNMFEDANNSWKEFPEWYTAETQNMMASLKAYEWSSLEEKIFNYFLKAYNIKDRRFTYYGIVYEAVGNIKGGFVEKAKHLCGTRSSYIVNRDDFYKVAKKNRASVDVYKIKGEYYMLASGSCDLPEGSGVFFKVQFENSEIKVCDEYTTWYN